ncbi:GNAT family N-acetyltransferase [Nocardioides sp.]|uniref:GNAT family N-acetyltransferase n=1 Tax=Nocardioides sp. TaxID=35761 RepID=UPI002B79C7C7|nr:GNAT family N-acetyltransferase [Nocardioides sp.]HSX67598.1 GNAT family N-acetyltransferase [Nocardioides sp.]
MNDQMTELVEPALELYSAWAECVADYDRYDDMNGSGWWWIDAFGADLDSCRALIAKADQLRTNPPEGLVVSDCYWIAHGGEVIGFLMLRRSLDNEFLRTEGGHIGYSIRPSHRRRGHASRALRLALDAANSLGIDRVLITCEEENVASARTIESQGGVFESTYAGKRRYWVETAVVD